MHQRIVVVDRLLIHGLLSLTTEGTNRPLLLAVKHDTASQLAVLVILDRANLLERAREVSRRVHLLHDMDHVGRGQLFLFHLLLEVSRQSLLVLLLQLFVLSEVVRHYPVDLLEILEDHQPRELFLVSHVLVQIVV